MSVMIETSRGDIVIDLYIDEAPSACKNFLKLCKMKYYNNCLFHNVQRNFIAQTGDPTGTGKGGDSVYGLMYGSQARFFDDEISPKRKHTGRGCVGMASPGPNLNASQFYITLADSLTSLDERHTLFGTVSEGLELLEALNEVPVDAAGRPLQNIRIRHTYILEDPFDDPPQLAELMPDASPPPTFEHGDRLEEDWQPLEDERPAEEIEKETRAAEAKNRAVVLEMIGDLPEAEAKPPSNMLFVCKLNPVTTEEDLEIIFSRFGNVTACDIIRDYKTGDSLCYAFIGFDSDDSCEAAYFKMNNVLIDDRRIRVDFSQSVSHIWKQFKRHGKKGGTADMAAEADQHQRGAGSQGPGSRGGGNQRAGGAPGGMSRPWQQQQQQQQPRAGGGAAADGGSLLFDHHQQQTRHHQPGEGDGSGARRRWGEPAAANKGADSSGRSTKRREHSRSRSTSSSSGASEHRRKKHKKDKKEKKEKKVTKERKEKKDKDKQRQQAVESMHQSAEGGSSWRHQQQQQHSRHDSGYHDDRDRDRLYSNSNRDRDRDRHFSRRDRDNTDSRGGSRYEEDKLKYNKPSSRGDDKHRGSRY